MTGEAQQHNTSISIVQASSEQVYAGADMALKVRVLCPEGCNLRDGELRVTDHEGEVVQQAKLTGFDGSCNETEEFVLKAPVEPGEYTWAAAFPVQATGTALHKESSAAFSFTVKPHSTSMVAWDVPSPVAIHQKFALKIGVKCSAQCNLAGREVQIYNQEGARVTSCTLSDAPWLNTAALYWAEIELTAPGAHGHHVWSAKFADPQLDLPHDEATCTFAFGTAGQPEHVATIRVIAHETKSPISKAHVLLRPDRGYPYRGSTDAGGVVKIAVPEGQYELYVSKVDHVTFWTQVKITDDVTIETGLVPAPPDLY